MMDWKDALGSLLPEDYTPEPAAPEQPQPQAKRKLTVSVERKGRGGKTATIISGFTESDAEVAELASRLKKILGTGGSARGGEILIQGDRRADVLRALEQL